MTSWPIQQMKSGENYFARTAGPPTLLENYARGEAFGRTVPIYNIQGSQFSKIPTLVDWRRRALTRQTKELFWLGRWHRIRFLIESWMIGLVKEIAYANWSCPGPGMADPWLSASYITAFPLGHLPPCHQGKSHRSRAFATSRQSGALLTSVICRNPPRTVRIVVSSNCTGELDGKRRRTITGHEMSPRPSSNIRHPQTWSCIRPSPTSTLMSPRIGPWPSSKPQVS